MDIKARSMGCLSGNKLFPVAVTKFTQGNKGTRTGEFVGSSSGA